MAEGEGEMIILTKIRYFVYIGKRFEYNNKKWMVLSAIQSLPHKEQKFVCVSGENDSIGMTIPISYLRRIELF